MGAMDGCKASCKDYGSKIQMQGEEEQLKSDSMSVKKALSPRLISFKGIGTVAPSRDLQRSLKSRAMVPLLLVVATAQTANLVWQHGPLLATEIYKQLLGIITTSTSSQIHLLHNFFPIQYLLHLQAEYCNIALYTMAIYMGLITMAFMLSVQLLRWFSFFSASTSKTYLLDFACYKPPNECKMGKAKFIQLAIDSKLFNDKSIQFQKRILEGSGLGEETYVPPSMHHQPTDFSVRQSLVEAEMALCGAMEEVMRSNGVRPHDIDILVVNSSVFCPTPSLSAMVVNHFKLRENIESFNLGGMGCSAGVLAVGLARDLLQVHKNSVAVVLSAEIISGLQGYRGNDRSMMVGNCIFRWGASAVLLSNKQSDRRRAKYELMHVVKTHNGSSDKSFKCVSTADDAEGLVGISLSKELMEEAGLSLKTNITTLAPKVLPLSEKLKFASNFVSRKLLKTNAKAYVPNFQKALHHFCIHPGGKAVLDGIQKNLQLSEYHMEPSRMTLHRFGNTSSSSVWYVLAYMEGKKRVRKGDLVWQIALGSGIKCNSAIWKSLRSDHVGPSTNPWHECVDDYPITNN